MFAEFYMFVVAALSPTSSSATTRPASAPSSAPPASRKVDYLYGRFLGAFGAALVGYLAVPLGLWLGASAWWLDHETLGPFVLGDYV